MNNYIEHTIELEPRELDIIIRMMSQGLIMEIQTLQVDSQLLDTFYALTDITGETQYYEKILLDEYNETVLNNAE
jgi:hypothetical protein